MDAPTVNLGVNSTEFIRTMDKNFIKEIENQLGYLIDSNDTEIDRADFGLQMIQAIEFLSTSVQDLANIGLLTDIILLQTIDADCANF